MGPREARSFVEGALLKFDRDMAQAEKYFQDSREGKPLWRNIEKLRTRLKTSREGLRKARRLAAKQAQSGEEEDDEGGELEEAQEKVQETEQELIEAMADYRREAANFPYVDEDKEIELAMEGKESTPTSAKDRMVMRLAQLRYLSSSHYSKAIRLNALAFLAIGVPLFDKEDEEGEIVEQGILAKIVTAKIDMKLAHLRRQFAPEKSEEKKGIKDDIGKETFELDDEDFDEELEETKVVKKNSSKKTIKVKPEEYEEEEKDVDDEEEAPRYTTSGGTRGDRALRQASADAKAMADRQDDRDEEDFEQYEKKS